LGACTSFVSNPVDGFRGTTEFAMLLQKLEVR